MKKQKPNNSNDWESRWKELRVKSYNLKTEKWQLEPLMFINEKSEKIFKSFISSELQRERERVIEEFAKIVDKSCDKDFGTYDYKQIAEDFISEINSLRKIS